MASSFWPAGTLFVMGLKAARAFTSPDPVFLFVLLITHAVPTSLNLQAGVSRSIHPSVRKFFVSGIQPEAYKVAKSGNALQSLKVMIDEQSDCSKANI